MDHSSKIEERMPFPQLKAKPTKYVPYFFDRLETVCNPLGECASLLRGVKLFSQHVFLNMFPFFSAASKKLQETVMQCISRERNSGTILELFWDTLVSQVSQGFIWYKIQKKIGQIWEFSGGHKTRATFYSPNGS